ncbi:substrate-binding domain-containing protein [Streptomyces malaysiensis]|uniref:substrate-binding domain-containing protein n=1 Tax=Streptomyces malaysiensis TaxID=92644 RepID=UPI003699B787
MPEDVAVVGFDDIEPAAYTEPPLTTVRQPIAETALPHLVDGARLGWRQAPAQSLERNPHPRSGTEPRPGSWDETPTQNLRRNPHPGSGAKPQPEVWGGTPGQDLGRNPRPESGAKPRGVWGGAPVSGSGAEPPLGVRGQAPARGPGRSPGSGRGGEGNSPPQASGPGGHPRPP